jgi:hypothetical protein
MRPPPPNEVAEVAEVAAGLFIAIFLPSACWSNKRKICRLQIFNNWSPYLVKNPDSVWLIQPGGYPRNH